MINWKRSIALIVWIVLLAPPAVSFASSTSLQNELDALTAKLSSNAGIAIMALDSGKTIYDKNAGTALNPASVTKLITAAAALRYLGPDFRFHTKFFVTPDGDLFIRGEGNPSFVIEELRMVADSLKKKGVMRVRNILIDDSYFSDYTSPGLNGKNGGNNLYTGALSINFNRISIYVAPGKRIGENAKVRADAGDVDINIDNRVITMRGSKGGHISFDPPLKDGEDHFIVSGQIPIRRKAGGYQYHVSLPPLYFAEALKALFKDKNVAVVGSIYRSPEPKNAKLILDHESKPLSEILKDMNKVSNNFIAEQLVKFLGAKFAGVPGSTEKGIMVFQKYLANLGIRPGSYHLVNGSGLTYENRMSADQIVRVIQDMYNSKRLWPHFADSLSIAGRDGTLRRRHRRDALHDRLRAKTGTVNGVRAIAGVVPSDGSQMIAFAILLNGRENISGYRRLQENIALTIIK